MESENRLNDIPKEQQKSQKTILTGMLFIFFVVFVWSVIKPFTMLTWFLEALPAILMVLVLALTYRRFQFTTLVYFVVLLHTVILLIGAKYTYERNPLFNQLRDMFELSRNYYDRVGHFAQGVTPAFMAKEILLRKKYTERNKMFFFIVICMVLAVSAFYELLEFAASIISGVPGYIVLSYQGDEWDTQMDILMALVGGVISLFVLGPLHDKFLKRQDEIDE